MITYQISAISRRRAIMQPIPNINEFRPPFFFFSNDIETTIRFISPSVTDVLGYCTQALLGRPYTEILVPAHAMNRNFIALHKRRFAGDNCQTSFCVVYDSAKQIRVLSVQTYGERNTKKRMTAIHGLAQDITTNYNASDEIKDRFLQLNRLQSRLSDKERQVLELVLDGRLNKSIAREFAVSERAIEMTRARLMNKFDAATTAELIAKAVELRTLQRVFENRLSVG